MGKELTFDVLFRDLFNAHSRYTTISDIKIPHPLDIYEDNRGLTFEIACTGLRKEDVIINIEHDILRVTYTKPKQEEAAERTYQLRNIAKRAFDLGYKISPKYDMTKCDATMENGLLIIKIPFAKGAEPRSLQIK